jgi:hypothetical protein
MLAELQQQATSWLQEHSPIHPKTTLPLLAALEQLDIEPFSISSVEAYKNETLHRVMNNEVRRYLADGYSFSPQQHMIDYPVEAHLPREWFDGARFLVQYFCKEATHLTQPNTYFGAQFGNNRMVKVGIGAGGRTGSVVILFIFAMKWFRRPFPLSNFEEMGNEVPPNFVWQKMQQITATVPGVTFETDWLRGTERGYDPFMIAKFGTEEYYFEVWGDDDHKFPR